MGSRLDLQTLLEETIGTESVYFQPPENFKMVYPCIVYERDSYKAKFANNAKYANKTRYKVTLIDKNPESVTIDKLNSLQLCSFNRHYVADNLNHDVFNIYY